MSFLESELRNIKTTGPLAMTVKTKVIGEGVVGPKWDTINTEVALAWMIPVVNKRKQLSLS